MPRPFTDEEIRIINITSEYEVGFDDKLGFYIHDPRDAELSHSYSYEVSNDGNIKFWVNAKTFKLRQRLGRPNPPKRRNRLRMREMDFGLEEMEVAERIMEG